MGYWSYQVIPLLQAKLQKIIRNDRTDEVAS